VPVKPKFGGIAKISSDSWVAWTGGKPKADWTDLEKPNPVSIAATQYRSNSVSSQAKSHKYRVEGLETKFTRTSKMQTFEKKVMKHLVAHGLDTVTYLRNPADPNKVVSVIDSHALFNLKKGQEAGNKIKEDEFDTYCHDNDRDAKEFLFNSVDSALETQLLEDTKDEDSFVSVWLALIHITRSVSVDRFDKVKQRFKQRKIADYAGENLEAMSTDYLEDYNELHSGQMYDQTLTLTMLTEIMQAGGDSTEAEDFRFPLRAVKNKLKEKLLNIRHMNYADAHEQMVGAELDVPSMLKAIKLLYRDLYDDNKWPAQRLLPTAKASTGTLDV